MGTTYNDYISRKKYGEYSKRRRLEREIGIDTYDADFKSFVDAVSGGNAYRNMAEFEGAKSGVSDLLRRTEALKAYVERYGGDASGVGTNINWLSAHKQNFDNYADYAEYEKLHNYDFERANSQLADLNAQLEAIPNDLGSVFKDLGFAANDEQWVPTFQRRDEIKKQIEALEKEIGRARVISADKIEETPLYHADATAQSTNPSGVEFGSEDSKTVDWQHEYINGYWDSKDVHSSILEENPYEILDAMTDVEKSRYNYFYNTSGKDAAQQYLNGLYDTLHQRVMQGKADYAADHPVLGTLGSIGAGFLGAIAEPGNAIAGNTNYMAELGDTMRAGVADSIDSDFGKFLYNTGVSGLQSLAAGTLLGPAGGVALGLSAMSSTRNDLLRRGADTKTATMAGIAAGIFEGLFETISLGQFGALKEVPVNSFKDLALNLAKSAGVNASEEMATEIANVLYDTFANGDFSNAQLMLREYMAQGMSEEEARAQIAKEFGLQIVEAGASGALMGVGFGGVGSAVSGTTNAVNAARVGKSIKAGESSFGSLSSVTELGEKYGIKQAVKVKAKGTKASNRAVGDLYRRVSAAVASENKSTTVSAIEKRLSKLGADSAKSKQLAEVVLKKYMRQSLSLKESRMLDHSKVARQALGEMLEDANSKWINDLKATLKGEASRDISTIGNEDVAAAAEQAAEIARSEGPEVQISASGETLGALPQIASIGVDGVTLASPSGEVALDDAAMTEDKAMLYTLARLLPSAEIANAFVGAWDGVTDPEAYFRAYQMIYTYGRNHTGYSDAQITEAGKKAGLNEAQAISAFKSGMKSLAEERRLERERLDGIIQKFRESGAKRPEGKWDAKALRGVNLKKIAKENMGLQDIEQFVAFLRMTTKAFGWNVRVIADNAEGHSNGGYNPKNNTLTFNVYSGTMIGTELVRTAMPNTISHETLHWMKRNAPKQYHALEDMVLAALKNANDYDFDAAVKKEYGKYKEKYGQNIDDPTAREEIVARACEDLFGRSEAIKQFLADFAEKNKEAATGFTAAVKKVLAKIKAFFENLMFGASSRTLEAGIVRKCGTDVVQGLQEQYEKTFFAALEGNAARNALGEFEQGGEMFAEGLTRTNPEKMHVKGDEGLKSDFEDDVDYVDYEKPITLADVTVLRSIGRKSVNAFTSEEIKKAQKWAYKFYQKLGVKSPFFRAWFGDWRAEDQDRVSIVEVGGNKQYSASKAINSDVGEAISWGRDFKGETINKATREKVVLQGIYDIKEIAKNAVLLDTCISMPTSKTKMPNTAFMHSFYVLYKEGGGNIHLLKLFVEEALSNNEETIFKRAYELKDIQKIANLPKSVLAQRGGLTQGKSATISIADLFALVKQYDKEFSPKSVNKALLNEDGMPRVFYHGTDADFTKFDPHKQGSATGSHFYGKGFYFSTSEEDARRYGSNVMRVYLRAEKVLDLDKDNWARELGIESDSPRVEVDRVSIEDLGNGFANIYYTTKADQNTWRAMDRVSQMRFNSAEGGVHGFLERQLNQGEQLLPRDVKNLSNLARSKGYDAIIGSGTNIGDVGREIVVFKPEQIKSATDNIGTYDGGNDNMLHSDPEDDVKSDREILVGLVLEDVQNTQEYAALKKYQAKIKSLDAKSKEVVRLNREIDELRYRKGKRGPEYYKQMDALVKERNKLDNEIRRADRLILELSKPLQDLVVREKKRTKELWKAKGEKAMSEYREKNLQRVYIERIEKRAKSLRKLLVENSEKYHIPDAFKKPVAAFLSLLDFSSERSLKGGEATLKDKEIQSAFAEVVTLLESLTDENDSEYLAGLDLPPDVVEEFVSLSKEVAQMAIDGREGDTMVLRRMSSEQLKALNSTLYEMGRAVRQANELFTKERFRHVSEMALDFIGNSEQYVTREKRSKISDFLSWENMVPYYAFRRLGAAGEALFKGFMQGQDTFAFLVKEIIDFTDKLYTEDEVKKWTREVHTFDGTNGKVYITTAQIMSLYELWKDKDARQHILGGGGRIEDIVFGAKKKYANDPNGTALGELVVDAMFAKLTPRQKAVADSLQRFMAEECAKWGNEISYKRWGIRLFGLDYYFPIESDKNTLKADVEQRAKENGLFSLLHKSFTKKRVFKANNRIMIRSVFDVFASHTTDMAKYNAFALPLLDMQKFINFKEIVRPDGEGEITAELPADSEQNAFTTKEVRTSMEKAFGTAAYKYIEQFLIDLNGNIGGRSAAESILQKGITAHKIAAVGANLRVALLQPTAYVRLLNVMKPKYFFGGLGVAGRLKTSIERMQKYSGIALWKSLGYRDTNVAAPIQTKIKHDESVRDKLAEKSMILAELGDKLTWGMIWHACELETRDKRADLVTGSDAYYHAVAERFTEVIYATQVVDSTFTKSQFMRKKDFFSTLFTSFMSEPTLSYNLLAANALSLADAKRRGGKITLASVRPFVRAAGAFALSALAQALVSSLIDAARDDDEEKAYGEKYWEEFLSNVLQEIVPFNLVPIIKDIWSIALATMRGDYYNSSRMDLEVYNRIAKATKAIGKMFEDGEVSYSAIHKILSALSSATGLPISNLIRDVIALWNTIFGGISKRLIIN